MSYKKQLLQGSIYYFIGSVIAAGFAYLIKLILIRNLSVEEYGLFFSVFTFVLFFGIFSSLGLNSGIARFIAEYNIKKQYGQIKSLISGSFLIRLISSFFIVIIFWIISDYLAINYFGDERASILLKILAFYLPLNIGYNNFRSIFQGLKKSKIFSLTATVHHILVIIGILIGIYFGVGIFIPIIGYLGSLIIFVLIFIIPFLKNFNYFKFKHENFLLTNKKLLFFSLPLIITSVGGLIITYFDTLMLTYFDTLANVGVYNIIYPSALLLLMIGTSIGAIILPIITELWTLEKKQEISNALKIINKYLLVISLPLVIVLLTFSKELIRIFFGVDYVIGTTAFNILLIGALFLIFNGINNQILIGIKEPKKMIYIYISGAVLNVIFNLFLIPKYSLTGAAIASATSFLLMMLLSMYYINQKIKEKIPWKEWFLIILFSSIIPISSKLFAQIRLNIYLTTIVGLIIGGCVYLLLLYLFKILDLKEVMDIVK